MLGELFLKSQILILYHVVGYCLQYLFHLCTESPLKTRFSVCTVHKKIYNINLLPDSNYLDYFLQKFPIAAGVGDVHVLDYWLKYSHQSQGSIKNPKYNRVSCIRLEQEARMKKRVYTLLLTITFTTAFSIGILAVSSYEKEFSTKYGREIIMGSCLLCHSDRTRSW